MARKFDWRISDEHLLDLRFRDLPISIDAPFIAKHVECLYAELQSRGISFRPHVWLADEWFSADGVPGFAIPFYLAHPRLIRLERKLLREAEGSNGNWMMRILRHEAAHAIDTAYRIRRRKDWRDTFGRASLRYPTKYRPDPASHDHVQHLGSWYAQSHPTEDFAETFAVWLQPRSRWRREYAQWPRALAKLQYVDALMDDLAGTKPKVRLRQIVEPLSQNKRTLREHYRRELAKYAIERGDRFDMALLKVFVVRGNGPSASKILLHLRRAVMQGVVSNRNLGPYVVYNVVRAIVDRCRELQLTAPSAAIVTQRAYAQRITRTIIEIVLAHARIDSAHRRRQQYAL
jgi:hypothetical protein